MNISQKIDTNHKLGFYTVGREIFYTKAQAYIYASQVNIDPVWHFNNNKFQKIDWEIEPTANLKELYRLRAQQLRDRYDYVRVEASGGGDSTTVIFSFLLNGIHLDEVIFRYPKTGDTGAVGTPLDRSANNTLGEFQFAAQPLLNWIKTNFPKTRVTIHDFGENMNADDKSRDESWIFQTRHWMQPSYMEKFSNLGTKDLRDLADSGKNICVIFGVDKPRLTLINGHWYFYFFDSAASQAHPVNEDHNNITSEYFYWTPDFPEIVIKQSHLVKQWFDMPHNRHLVHLVKWPNHSFSQRTTYEHVVKSIIYPDYDLNTWQTDKPTNNFYNEMDYFFYKNFKDNKIYSVWQAGLDLLINKVDPKYFIYEVDKPISLLLKRSNFYALGPSKMVESIPAFSNQHESESFHGEVGVVQNCKFKRILI